MPPKKGKKGKKGKGKEKQDDEPVPEKQGTPEPTEKEELLQTEYVHKCLYMQYGYVPVQFAALFKLRRIVL